MASPISSGAYGVLHTPGTVRRLIEALGLSDQDRVALLTAGKSGGEVAPGPSGWRTTSSALPVKLTSFLGRENDVAAIRQRLEVTRLLVMVGPGGIGKTRLALEVASSLADRYADGIFVVDLAPLAAPELVVQAVARSLGLRIELDRQPHAAIVSFLAERQLLLILDNCEHLVMACAELVMPLVQNCPGAAILATSREPLEVEGETVWRVDPLDGAAAMNLFVDRASARRPDFDAGDGTVIRQLCKALDHMPLAIELAAARATLLTPAEILGRLEDRFALLARVGGRGGTSRHETLRATLDSSYELLEPAESQLFRRLAVYAGPFDMAAANAMGGPETLNVLGRLVDKSLVMAQPTERGTRYRLLDTLRHYAWERLQEAGEVELARQRHLNHFLAWAEALFTLGYRMEALDRELDSELDNLRSAFEWCYAADHNAGLRLVGLTWGVWWRRSFAEGRRWARAFLERCPEPSLARAQALITAAAVESLGDPAEARRLLWEARMYVDLLDQATLAMVDLLLGIAAFSEEDVGEATSHFERVLSAQERLGDVNIIRITHVRLGYALLTDHTRREEGRVRLEYAKQLAEQRGETATAAYADYGLGLYWRWVGQPWRALAHFRRILEPMGNVEDVPDLSATLLQIARLLAQSDPVRTARLASAGLALADRAGVHLPPRLLSRIEQLRTELGRQLGDEPARRAWTEGERMTMEEAVACALEADHPKAGAGA